MIVIGDWKRRSYFPPNVPKLKKMCPKQLEDLSVNGIVLFQWQTVQKLKELV